MSTSISIKNACKKRILKEYYVLDAKQRKVTLARRIYNSPRKQRISLAIGWSEYHMDAN